MGSINEHDFTIYEQLGGCQSQQVALGLTPLDMLTSKPLTNSDRWSDDGVINRDVIDLAMMMPSLPMLRKAVAKAEQAYGESICQDLDKAIGCPVSITLTGRRQLS